MGSTSDSGLAVTISGRDTRIHAVLTKVPQTDEPQTSHNVTLLWQQPGSGSHSDISAEQGLVFAPQLFGGTIEILDAKTGKLLGTAVAPPPADLRRPNIILDVKARGNLLYAATESQGLLVFDVSQPEVPELLAQYRVDAEEGSPENFFNIHNIFLPPDGRHLYAINQSFPETELQIIDVSDPASPRVAGRFSIPDSGGLRSVHDINVTERDGRLVAFLNYLGAGLWVLDVTDPGSITVLSNISWEGIFSHSGWAFALADQLYYAHTSEGYDKHLTVLDVTDLANPRIVSRFATRPGIYPQRGGGRRHRLHRLLPRRPSGCGPARPGEPQGDRTLRYGAGRGRAGHHAGRLGCPGHGGGSLHLRHRDGDPRLPRGRRVTAPGPGACFGGSCRDCGMLPEKPTPGSSRPTSRGTRGA